MRPFLYLVGPPGVGKSTLLAAVLHGLPAEPRSGPPAHLVYPGGAQLGGNRPGHPGTDALLMNAISHAMPWLKTQPFPAIVAEGDRLACDTFFGWIENCGYRLTVAYLWAPEAVLNQRRAARGSTQNEAWMKGRATKAERLAKKWGAVVLDGRLPVEELALQLMTQPAFRRIRGEPL